MKTGITVKSQISKDLSKPAQYQRKGYEGIRGNEPRHTYHRTRVIHAYKQAYPSQAH